MSWPFPEKKNSLTKDYFYNVCQIKIIWREHVNYERQKILKAKAKEWVERGERERVRDLLNNDCFLSLFQDGLRNKRCHLVKNHLWNVDMWISPTYTNNLWNVNFNGKNFAYLKSELITSWNKIKKLITLQLR